MSSCLYCKDDTSLSRLVSPGQPARNERIHLQQPTVDILHLDYALTALSWQQQMWQCTDVAHWLNKGHPDMLGRRDPP